MDPSYVRLKKVCACVCACACWALCLACNTALQMLVDVYLAELESVKLSLKTRDIVEPVAQSKNRPPDAIQVSLSNLPSVNWGSAGSEAGGAAQPDLRVDDLLDILAGNSGAPSAQPPQQQALSGSSLSPSSSAPDPVYQSKYSVSMSNSATQDKHALFSTGSRAANNQASSRYQQQQQQGSGSHTQPGSFPRYPSLDAGPSSPLEMQQLTLVEQQQQQQVQSRAQAHLDATPSAPCDPGMVTNQPQPSPSFGVQLGPQEAQVCDLGLTPRNHCHAHAPHGRHLLAPHALRPAFVITTLAVSCWHHMPRHHDHLPRHGRHHDDHPSHAPSWPSS